MSRPARPSKRVVRAQIDALRSIYQPDPHTIKPARSAESLAHAEACIAQCERVLTDGPTLDDLCDAAIVHVRARGSGADSCRCSPHPLGGKERRCAAEREEAQTNPGGSFCRSDPCGHEKSAPWAVSKSIT